ncbi:hypothetical protein Hanom_Chr14g01259721 [Helianthus anomalus]
MCHKPYCNPRSLHRFSSLSNLQIIVPENTCHDILRTFTNFYFTYRMHCYCTQKRKMVGVCNLLTLAHWEE